MVVFYIQQLNNGKLVSHKYPLFTNFSQIITEIIGNIHDNKELLGE